MSYQPISDRQDYEELNVQPTQKSRIESFMLEKEKEVIPNLVRFRKWCWIIVILAFPIPVIGWFVENYYHIIFYQSWALFSAQCLLGLAGLRATRENVYRRLDSYQKFIHIYFIAFLAFLIINQSLVTWIIVKHNKNNCDDFTYNKVCDDRWGIMGGQMILILFYPAVDFSIFILYRYYLQIVLDVKNALLLRDL